MARIDLDDLEVIAKQVQDYINDQGHYSCVYDWAPAEIQGAVAELRAARAVVDAANMGPAESFWALPKALDAYDKLINDGGE